jgi:hypothetical protein
MPPRWATTVADLQPLVDQHDCLKEVRGLGMMMALEFGEPKSLRLKLSWKMLETANRGLFSQIITVPLFTRHRLLSQVAGYGMNVVKFIPPLILTDERSPLDCGGRHGCGGRCPPHPRCRLGLWQNPGHPGDAGQGRSPITQAMASLFHPLCGSNPDTLIKLFWPMGQSPAIASPRSP